MIDCMDPMNSWRCGPARKYFEYSCCVTMFEPAENKNDAGEQSSMISMSNKTVFFADRARCVATTCRCCVSAASFNWWERLLRRQQHRIGSLVRFLTCALSSSLVRVFTYAYMYRWTSRCQYAVRGLTYLSFSVIRVCHVLNTVLGP